MRFGTDGVRGAAHTELTEAYVAVLGRAAAAVLGGTQWVVGRDTRESGPAFEAALTAGLRAGGASVESAGVLPTPALAHVAAVRHMPVAMITASHNPYGDNGVKLFAAGGLKLSDDVERAVEQRITELLATPAAAAMPDMERAPNPDVGPEADAAAQYVDHLVGLFPPDCLTGMHLVLDCANGAMSTVAPLVARTLGAQVEVIHAEPDGRNINAECGATAPGSLAAAVLASGAELGLAFDGDGDRVIAVDEHGAAVDGDRLLALAALQLRDAEQLVDDTVVITVMSNLGFRHAMAAAGITIVETAVGDRYVLEALDAGGYSLGGEQSGHLIYRRLATTGDGLLAGMRLAQHVGERRRSLAELAGAVMTTYPQVLLNVAVADRRPGAAADMVAALDADVATAESRLHGDGRILVRASGTEPLIRVMVEAPTTELAASTANDLADVVRLRFG